MLFNRHWLAILGLSAACLSGCGGGESAAPTAESGASKAAASNEQAGSQLPTASIASAGNAAVPEEDDIKIEKPKEGTPEAKILEMTQLWLKPFPETDDVEKQREARRERNTKIIEMATDVIAVTHNDKEKEQLFNIGVHRLMEATFQLAMQGDQDSVNSLYENASALHSKNPKSKAAADAGWFVAKFADENAIRYASQDPRWVKEFSRQARSFAEKFPQDQNRALALLNDAALSCDVWGLTEDSIQCYAAIRQKYPESEQAEAAVAPLRRLNLPGNVVDLGGPTIDGGFVSVEEFKGSPVLIVFWSTEAKNFVDQSKDLIATTGKYESKGLHVIGVSVDTDELAIDKFAESSGMSWRNIYHADPAKRGWNSPVVTYYGVQNIPQMWLVGADGKVLSTGLQAKDLDATLAKVTGSAKSKPAATAAASLSDDAPEKKTEKK